MPYQRWSETVVTQKTAGTLFNTYTTAKTIINHHEAMKAPPAGTTVNINAHTIMAMVARGEVSREAIRATALRILSGEEEPLTAAPVPEEARESSGS